MRPAHNGYVALISILVVGTASLAIGISLLINGSDAQRAIASAQESLQARKLADACAEEALLKISETSSFTGSGNLTLSSGSCTYVVTSTGSSTRTISTTGTANEATRKVLMYVTITSSISITSWQEVI